jgi:hypothetical protein
VRVISAGPPRRHEHGNANGNGSHATGARRWNQRAETIEA